MDRIFRCELIYEPLISPREASIMFDPAKKIAVSAISPSHMNTIRRINMSINVFHSQIIRTGGRSLI